MMRAIRVFMSMVGLVGGMSICLASGSEREISVASLLEEMIDLGALTRFPEPQFRTVQFSSYDRRSQMPGGPDWFANSDGFGKEPIPNFEKVLKEPGEDGIGEYLMADVKGPGAVVRLWSAAINGELRVYVDEQGEPLYAGSAIDFFHEPYSQFPEGAALDQELLKKTLYQRDAAYAPIPFAKRLRVVWSGDLKSLHFYQMQVRLYPESTRVRSFVPGDLQSYSDEIGNVMKVLASPDREVRWNNSRPPNRLHATVQPGENVELLSLSGPGALGLLTLKLEAEHLQEALRQTVLHIVCDDFPWGQVQSPVGDFFGAAPAVNPYQSLPFTVRPDGTLVCRFVIPFEKRLVIRIENLGDQQVGVQGEAVAIDYEWDAERSMHFRARWRVDHDLTASNTAVQDLPFLLARGKGVYVGTTSYILNPNDVPTSYGNWWGEGDEKIFVDGDSVPSTFGTGSEDYYNYSWSSPDIFAFPYCGQPRNDGPGNRGFVANYRWQVLDALPFQKLIRFYMELFSHEKTPELSYARIGYYYARPGAIDDHLAIKSVDLRPQKLPPNWMPAPRMGARNSRFYPAEELLEANQGTRLEEGRLWEGGKLLAWAPSPGETLSFRVPIEQSGKYRIQFVARLEASGGTVTPLWDDATVNGVEVPFDLHRPHGTLSRRLSVGEMELGEGEHRLTLRFEGAGANVQVPVIGIDFIWVQRLDN